MAQESRIKPIVVLFFASLISSLLLSWVYNKTRPTIEKEKELKINSSLSEVLPNASHFERVETKDLWIGYDEKGEKVGIVFKTAPRGYGGPISILCGLDSEEKVTGIRIASPAEGLKETPGLGLKVRDFSFRQQFLGKKEAEIKLKNDGGEISAITAATISSRAVVEGIREGIKRYREFLK